MAPGQDDPGTPYAGQLYAPAGLTQLATGAGVRVAVIDSGVQTDVASLHGHVEKGKDVLHKDPDGRLAEGIARLHPQPCG